MEVSINDHSLGFDLLLILRETCHRCNSYSICLSFVIKFLFVSDIEQVATLLRIIYPLFCSLTFISERLSCVYSVRHPL